MAEITPLEYGKIYHIYNRGVNSCTLFHNDENNRYFLKLYNKYIPQIADTLAWVLMGNHFHLLVRIKDEYEIQPFPPLEPPSGSSNSDGVPLPTRKPKPSHQLSHLFNAYAQAYNKVKSRTGPLFESPFHRKLVESTAYLKNLVIYIHNNPIHHNLNTRFSEYQWSSFNEILFTYQNNPNCMYIMNLFGNPESFISSHLESLKKVNSSLSELEPLTLKNDDNEKFIL